MKSTLFVNTQTNTAKLGLLNEYAFMSGAVNLLGVQGGFSCDFKILYSMHLKAMEG